MKTGLRIGYFECDDKLCRRTERTARPEFWDMEENNWQNVYDQGRFLMEAVPLTQEEAQKLTNEQECREELLYL